MRNPFIDFQQAAGGSRVTVISVEPNDGQFYRKGEGLIFKNGSFYDDAPSYSKAVEKARSLAKKVKPAELRKEPVEDLERDVEEFIDDAEERIEDTGNGFRGGGLWNGNF